MEKLTSISQLKPGDRFVFINAYGFMEYEFLCIHPHSENYIFAIDTLSHDAKKLNIANITDSNSNYFVGKYDRKFVTKTIIQLLKKHLKYLEDRLKQSTQEEQ